MFNIFAIMIGLVTLVMVAIAFVPPLGAANWLILPFAIVGAGIGQLSRGSKTGRNLCLIVILIGAFRLTLGFGLI